MGAAQAFPAYVEGKAADRKQTGEEQKAVANVGVSLLQIKSQERVAALQARSTLEKALRSQENAESFRMGAEDFLKGRGNWLSDGSMGDKNKVYYSAEELGRDEMEKWIKAKLQAEIGRLKSDEWAGFIDRTAKTGSTVAPSPT